MAESLYIDDCPNHRIPRDCSSCACSPTLNPSICINCSDYEFWTPNTNEFKPGDIVKVGPTEFYKEERTGVVTSTSENYCAFLLDDGFVGAENKRLLRKTGKTIDISAVLKQLKEDPDD